MPVISKETKLEEDNKHDEHAVAVILDSHIQLATYPVQLLQQCKTSAYERHHHIYVATWNVCHALPTATYMWLPGMSWRLSIY